MKNNYKNILLTLLLVFSLPSISFASILSGHVFEDISAELLLDGDLNFSDVEGDQRRLTNVTVFLYKDTGDEEPSVDDILVTSKLVNSQGEYSFDIDDLGLYYIAISMPRSNSAGDSTALADPAWGSLYFHMEAEQTYAYSNGKDLTVDGAVRPYCNDGNGNTILSNRANGACYGGKIGERRDSITDKAVGHEHITAVNVASTASITGVDFGFSFNVVTNTNDTGQGTFRQFARNAAVSLSPDTMRFVPTVPTNRESGILKWWEIVTTGLPDAGYSAIRPVIWPLGLVEKSGFSRQSGVVFDGRAFHFLDGVTRRDTTPGQIGQEKEVGADWDTVSLSKVDIPELCLKPEGPAVVLSSVSADRVSVLKNLCFINGGGNSFHVVDSGKVIIENNLINIEPDGTIISTDDKSFDWLTSVYSSPATFIYRNNYSAHLYGFFSSDGLINIENNEFYGSKNSSISTSLLVGTVFYFFNNDVDPSSTTVIKGNLFDSQQGMSIFLQGGHDIEVIQNTFLDMKESAKYPESLYPDGYRNNFINVTSAEDSLIRLNRFDNNGSFSQNAISLKPDNYGHNRGVFADRNQFVKINGMAIDWMPVGPSPTLDSPSWIYLPWTPEDMIDCHATDYISVPHSSGYSRPVLTAASVSGGIVTLEGKIRCNQGSFRVQLYANGGEQFLGESEEVILSEGRGAQTFTTTVRLIGNIADGTEVQALGVRMTVGQVHALTQLTPVAHTLDVSELSFDSGVVLSSGCSVSGETSEANVAVQGKLGDQDIIFMPSSEDSPIAGYLKAYKVNELGKPSSTALWDAANMSTTDREAKLYTSSSTNQLQRFMDSIPTDFSVATLSEANTIKSYTIDPSYSDGQYLEGRKSGHFLGAISRGNQVKILSSKADTMLSLEDSSYNSFVSNTLSQRQQLVVFTADDGFLYAVNYETGQLIWAWMPKLLLPKLQNPESFMAKHWMAGDIKIIDAKDANGSYATYIVGTYNKGLGRYVLKLQSNGQLQSVVSDDDFSVTYKEGVMEGAQSFISDSQGLYSIFSLTDTSGESVIKIQSITDANIDYTIDTNVVLSSKPYLSPDFHSRYAPEKNSLYLATVAGDVLRTPLLSASGNLLTKAEIEQNLVAVDIDVSTYGLPAEALTYIGVVHSGSTYYLRAQSEQRLTIYTYQSNQWKPKWTSFEKGAGEWQWPSGQYTVVNTTPPSLVNDHPINPINSVIQALPEDIVISGEARIVSGSLVLPAYIKNEQVCSAYYFLYDLKSGYFPSSTFVSNQGVAIAQNLYLGAGEAERLSLADLEGTGKMVGYVNVDQQADGSAGPPETFIIHDEINTGVRSWRIIE